MIFNNFINFLITLLIVMCCNGNHCNPKKDKIQELQEYFRALHCPIRWDIISIIGHEEKGTKEIYQELVDRGETLAKSSLYYHLGELRNGRIIEVSGYLEDGGGAPEKLWRLKTKEIKINLIEDLK
jgi:ArsR family transcriptional regulator, cadmium/lead-responsive transcriptional repressor